MVSYPAALDLPHALVEWVTMLSHAGKFFALKEDSPPVEMDPFTLETIGEYTFGGDFTSEAFTAHPKIDPRTGELVFYGYCAKGPATKDIAYYEADRTGKIIHETWFEAPYTCMLSFRAAELPAVRKMMSAA